MNAKVAVCAILALFLLSATLTDANPLARVRTELRCQCISTRSELIPPQDIQDVKRIESGPHCKDVEIIATLKDGSQECLDPTAAWVKRIIKAMLEKYRAEAEAESQL